MKGYFITFALLAVISRYIWKYDMHGNELPCQFIEYFPPACRPKLEFMHFFHQLFLPDINADYWFFVGEAAPMHYQVEFTEMPPGRFVSFTQYNDPAKKMHRAHKMILDEDLVRNPDGTITINIGGPEDNVNYFPNFSTWSFTFMLRVYRPTPETQGVIDKMKITNVDNPKETYGSAAPMLTLGFWPARLFSWIIMVWKQPIMGHALQQPVKQPIPAGLPQAKEEIFFVHTESSAAFPAINHNYVASTVDTDANSVLVFQVRVPNVPNELRFWSLNFYQLDTLNIGGHDDVSIRIKNDSYAYVAVAPAPVTDDVRKKMQDKVSKVEGWNYLELDFSPPFEKLNTWMLVVVRECYPTEEYFPSSYATLPELKIVERYEPFSHVQSLDVNSHLESTTVGWRYDVDEFLAADIQ